MYRYIPRQWSGERGDGATHDLGSNLDLLVTNNPTAVNRIEILPPFSDHNPVFTEVALSAKRAKQKPRVVPAYKRANWDRIKAALNAVHQEILEKVRTASSIDSIWTLFGDKLFEAINEHIPSRTIKESMRLQWATTRLRRLGRRRDRASKRARRNGHDPRLRALARQLKHDHQRAMRKAYWDFIDNLTSMDNEDHLLTDKRPPKAETSLPVHQEPAEGMLRSTIPEARRPTYHRHDRKGRGA